MAAKKPAAVCQLGREPGPVGSECSPDLCRRCGWNQEEARRRKNCIRAGMLEVDAAGIARLMIRKAVDGG